MLRRVSLTLLLSFTFISLVTQPVFAQTASPGPLKSAMQLVCAKVTTVIDERVKNWEENEPQKEAAYQSLVAEIKAFIVVLNAADYDTSQLSNALTDLNNAIIKRHDDRQIYINDLKDTQKYACGKSEGKFLESLNVARKQWKVVFSDTLQIKKIWDTEVRPAIQALKNQKLSITPTVSL